MPKVLELVNGGARWVFLPTLPLSDHHQVISPHFLCLPNEMTGHNDLFLKVLSQPVPVITLQGLARSFRHRGAGPLGHLGFGPPAQFSPCSPVSEPAS